MNEISAATTMKTLSWQPTPQLRRISNSKSLREHWSSNSSRYWWILSELVHGVWISVSISGMGLGVFVEECGSNLVSLVVRSLASCKLMVECLRLVWSMAGLELGVVVVRFGLVDAGFSELFEETCSRNFQCKVVALAFLRLCFLCRRN
ncbi:hypothetical protein Droror1_Dr00027362, partial [Drosera rotundifolia]